MKTARRPISFAHFWQLFVLLAAIVAGGRAVAAEQTQVERGEYLARAGDCMGCHTAKGGAPFAGGLRIDTPFGYMLSSNITPDLETGIGRDSSADFYRALHDGVNRHGKDMYPAMPYDFYTKLTRADVDAIYAYLRTVKPVHNAVEVNHLRFPFDLRWTMGAWRELYFTEGTYRPDPTKTAAWNRGAYLVEGPGHCSDCHSPRNRLGGIEKDRQYSGADVDGWFALALAPDIANGLGAWSPEDIARYLKTGVTPGKDNALGPMADFIRDSTSHLTDADRLAMAGYLKSIPPDSRLRTGRVDPDATKRRGAQLYSDNCGSCHQALGRGMAGVFPPLTGNPEVLAADPSNLLQIIDRGIPARLGYGPMPGFQTQLTDQQVAEIANYVRSSWGNKAPPNATSARVATLRAGN
ncbi:MAG: c-type cytochrome [Burkholderiales bacterium]|nr:c-type cytochrome [Burkholderiales bacterium]